jgi:uncharacterized membrane protein YhaH (DUF805 family)
MDWYIKVFQNYATFTGRARRKEYWTFFFVNLILSIGFTILIGVTKLSALTLIYFLYRLSVMVPTLAVSVRRMHDTDHSGWWLICPIYNFVLLVSPGDTKENRFGPDPIATQPQAQI